MSEVVPYDIFKMIFYRCDFITQIRIKQTNRRNNKLDIYEIPSEVQWGFVNSNIYINFPNIKSLYGHGYDDDCIQNLADLEKIYMGRDITDRGIINKHKLKILHITNNLNEITDRSIRTLKNLECLLLIKNHDISDNSIKYLTNLQEIDIYESEIITNNSVRYLKKLRILTIAKCPFISDEVLPMLPNLEKINSWDNTNIDGKNLINLPKLTSLTITMSDKLKDEYIKNLINLTELVLNTTKITNNGISLLTNLKILDISDNVDITDEGIKNLTNLYKLNIENTKKINGYGLRGIKNLELLNIKNNKNVRDEDIKGLVNLRILKMEGTQISMKWIYYMESITDICVGREYEKWEDIFKILEQRRKFRGVEEYEPLKYGRF